MHALVSVLIFLATPAWAVLGADSSGVSDACSKLNGTLDSSDPAALVCTAAAYKVTFLINGAGKVYQVRWEGRRTPPIKTLVGTTYLPEVQASAKAIAAKPERNVGRFSSQKTSKLMIHRGGHGRFHFGEITIPDLAPDPGASK